MLKLMKYEFRKGLAMKGVILGVIAALAILFTVSYSLESIRSSSFMTMGVVFTVIAVVFAYIYVAFENVFSLSQEIDSNKGYMLFMTPSSSYKIIAAKMLTGLIQMLVLVVVFLALAYYLVLVMNIVDGNNLSEVLPFVIVRKLLIDDPHIYFLRVAFYIGVSWTFGVLFMMLAGSLSVILTSFLKLGNRVLNALVTFVMFLIIKFGGDILSGTIIKATGVNGEVVIPGDEFNFMTGNIHMSFDIADQAYNTVMSTTLDATRTTSLITVAVYIALSVVIYLVASYLLERKVNL